MTRSFETTRPDDYLMRLAASDLGRGYKAMAASELALAEGQVVLDVGCGPGADLRAFGEAVGSHGCVLGIDHDVAAVAAARELVADADNISVSTGDAHALGLEAESVDRVAPVTAVFHDATEADEVLGLARVAGRAREAGYLSADAFQRWIDHLTTARFFASVTLFVVALDR